MRLLALLLVLMIAHAAVADGAPTDEQPKAPQGFVTKDIEPKPPEPVVMGPDDVVRYERVLAELMAAMENEDLEAYEALMAPRLLEKHRKANDPLSGLLDFMAAVMAQRGGFAKFHDLGTKGYQTAGTESPMLPAVFHLEDGMSGYIGIALDGEDQIDQFSLIVKEDVCRLGLACDLPVQEFPAEPSE